MINMLPGEQSELINFALTLRDNAHMLRDGRDFFFLQTFSLMFLGNPKSYFKPLVVFFLGLGDKKMRFYGRIQSYCYPYSFVCS